MGTRSKVKTRMRRLERLAEAMAKPTRTSEQQLEHLDKMGFRAVKERAKLKKRIAKEKK